MLVLSSSALLKFLCEKDTSCVLGFCAVFAKTRVAAAHTHNGGATALQRGGATAIKHGGSAASALSQVSAPSVDSRGGGRERD